MLTTYSYDDQGRLVLQKEVGLGKVMSVTSLGYDFTGDVTSEGYAVYPYDTLTQSYRTGPWQGIITHNYNHPHTKLPTSSVLQLTDGTNTMTDTIANCTYNDFARVTADNRSGTSADMSYTYDNLHGWLTGITGCNGRYAQRLYYGSDGSLPCYNGSIAAMTWRTGDDYVRRYDYGYDGLNRMTAADYSYYSIGSPASYEPTLSLMPGIGGDYEDYSVEYGYDRNGNITSVYRQGRLSFGDDDGYDTVEDDYVVRDGNRLKAYDTSPVGTPYYGSMDFHDGASMEVEYLYDANGSLIRDENRGVTYQYDLLGHLTSATTDKGPDNKYRRTEYVYTADGRCLRKVQRLYWNPSSTINQCLSTAETAYCGPFIMSNGTVVSFRFEGGYCSMGDGVPMACHFYLKDYQGSNRMVVNAATDAVEQVTHYYPYGGLMADISTGQGLQPYKYGGKELDRFGGLDLYDFGARQMDPLLPSFTSIDPMAEKYYSVSPYMYCMGNPVVLVDPDGRDGIICIFGNNITIGANVYLYGNGATHSVLRQMQEDINSAWGGNYSVNKNGVEYHVNFKINLALYGGEEKSNPLIIWDSWNPISRNNYIEVTNGCKRSEVIGNDKGTWRSKGRNGKPLAEDDPSPHEIGHILGLDDKYSDEIGPFGGWENNIMGNSSKGKVDIRNILDILQGVWQDYYEWLNKGNIGVYWYEINP